MRRLITQAADPPIAREDEQKLVFKPEACRSLRPAIDSRV